MFLWSSTRTNFKTRTSRLFLQHIPLKLSSMLQLKIKINYQKKNNYEWFTFTQICASSIQIYSFIIQYHFNTLSSRLKCLCRTISLKNIFVIKTNLYYHKMNYLLMYTYLCKNYKYCKTIINLIDVLSVLLKQKVEFLNYERY